MTQLWKELQIVFGLARCFASVSYCRVRSVLYVSFEGKVSVEEISTDTKGIRHPLFPIFCNSALCW